MHISRSSGEVRRRLREAFVWRGDGDESLADISGWWADADLPPLLGPALPGLRPQTDPALVLAPEAAGFALGPLAAVTAGAGFPGMRRGLTQEATGDGILLRGTPPDHLGRTIQWGVRRRVLFVDDWAETGATALTARRLAEDCGASWPGAAVLIDAASSAGRQSLNLRGFPRERALR